MNKMRAGAPATALWLLVAGSLLPVASLATESTDRLSLNGFYTFAGTYSDSHNASIPTLDAPIALDKGEATTKESLVGLQAQYAATDRLDLTLQAVSTRQIDNSYAPKLEWAYLNYDLGDNLHLRGGKMKLSLLQGIDLRYVGFSRLWVRPLVPSSGAGGFDNYAGAEFIKNVTAGDYNLKLQGGYGKAEHYHDTVHDRDVKLISGKVEKENSWLNLALLQARYDVDTETGIHLKNNATLFMGSVETELHLGNAVVNGGYAYGSAEINPDEQLVYLSIGYRIAKITPYLLRSQRKMIFNASEIMNALPPPPPGPPPPTPPPRPRDGTDSTDVLAVGLRYDLAPTYALKFQVDHWDQRNNSAPANGSIMSDGTLYTIVFEGVF